MKFTNVSFIYVKLTRTKHIIMFGSAIFTNKIEWFRLYFKDIHYLRFLNTQDMKLNIFEFSGSKVKI